MKNKGFTLMELMVVIVIIGIIAGFALPQYQRAIRKSHERDAIVQLTSIHAANTMYRAVADEYLPAAATLTAINSNLNLSIIANDMAYTYARSAPTAYTARASWNESGTANDFTVEVNQGALDNTNPCCVVVGSTCPSLPDC